MTPFIRDVWNRQIYGDTKYIRGHLGLGKTGVEKWRVTANGYEFLFGARRCSKIR